MSKVKMDQLKKLAKDFDQKAKAAGKAVRAADQASNKVKTAIDKFPVKDRDLYAEKIAAISAILPG